MLPRTLLTPILLFSIMLSLSVAAQASKEWTPTFKKGVNISHWLAQHKSQDYASPKVYSKEDSAWIAEHGFDHVRIPVDGKIILNIEGKLIEEMLIPFDKALQWAEEHQLGVIFDMHYLPGNEFLNKAEDNPLWTDEKLQMQAAKLWSAIAVKYQDVGSILRFEILNEAVAPENEQINVLNKLIVSELRKVDTERIIYVSSNLWGQFQTVPDLFLFKDDPNVHYALHTYHPHLFTHQGTPWSTVLKHLSTDSLKFPGSFKAPVELMNHKYIRDSDGLHFDEQTIATHFAPVATWAKENELQVVITEFGVYNKIHEESSKNWIRAIVAECDKAGFGWSIWDYKGGFAIHSDGEPTPLWEALFEK